MRTLIAWRVSVTCYGVSVVQPCSLIESLVRLRDYAAEKDLPAVAEHLDEAVHLAMTEIASKGWQPPPDGGPDTSS